MRGQSRSKSEKVVRSSGTSPKYPAPRSLAAGITILAPCRFCFLSNLPLCVVPPAELKRAAAVKACPHPCCSSDSTRNRRPSARPVQQWFEGRRQTRNITCLERLYAYYMKLCDKISRDYMISAAMFFRLFGSYVNGSLHNTRNLIEWAVRTKSDVAHNKQPCYILYP